MMKKIILFVGVCLAVGVSSPAYAFSDVLMTGSAYESVSYLVAREVVKGYEDGSFGVDKPINRVEALKTIFAAIEVDVGDGGEARFTDVPADAWFAKYVNYAANEGIVSVNATGTFSPGREVTRAEFLKMLITGLGIDPAAFALDTVSADVPEGTWFAPYINFATKFKILDQDEDGNAFPVKVVTRGEAVELIYRILRNGGGLSPQTLLHLTENHLITTIEMLEKADFATAAVAIGKSEKFVSLAIAVLSENNIVQSAAKVVQAVKHLVGAYVAGEDGRVNDVLIATGEAWNLANAAGSLNPDQVSMADSIKELSHSLADKTRKVKGEAEEIVAAKSAAGSQVGVALPAESAAPAVVADPDVSDIPEFVVPEVEVAPVAVPAVVEAAPAAVPVAAEVPVQAPAVVAVPAVVQTEPVVAPVVVETPKVVPVAVAVPAPAPVVAPAAVVPASIPVVTAPVVDDSMAALQAQIRALEEKLALQKQLEELQRRLAEVGG